MVGYKVLTVDGIEVGKARRPYIIAEMACAHNGRKDYALKLIDIAVKGNADAIQIQIFNVSEMIAPTHEAYDVIKGIEFSKSEWKEIVNYIKKFDIDLMINAYDFESLKFAVKLKADGIKFNSSDLLNIDMLEYIAKSKVPFTLHTGASSMDEIASAIEYVESFHCGQMILMHGVQNFPTSIENANISRIQLLKSNFNLPSGYDDHTDAEDVLSRVIDLIAVGVGADVLEKHITLSRAEKGIDYQSALEEDEFKKFVQQIHTASLALGHKKIKTFDDSDIRYRKFQKKSLVAVKDLKTGDKLQKSDFKFLRNKAVGLSPIESLNLLGKTLSKDIKAYDNILLGDFE